MAEFGLVGATMHMADEHVPVADLHALTAIYRAVLRAFAMKPPGRPAVAHGHRAARHCPGGARAQGGVLQFGGTPQAVLAALAPLVAFLLVGAVLGLVAGNRDAVDDIAVLAVLCWPAGALVRDRAAMGPGAGSGAASPRRSAGANGRDRWRWSPSCC